MEKKEELTIEELTKAYEEAKNNVDTLREKLAKAKQEEENRKRAELALTQQARKKEMDDAFAKYVELSKAYEKDYGPYVIDTYVNEFPWHLFWN